MKIFLSILGFLLITESNILLGQGNPSDSVLVVYLSRTNNTKMVAEIIGQMIEGDMVELELVNPYPENYDEIVQQVVDENASGYLPPLKTYVNIRKYDIIFLGFPTWGMQLPPPVKSFLSAHDLSGKTVIPFNTHAGYGVGSAFRQVKELCRGCQVLKGFSTKGGIERDGILLVIKGNRYQEVASEVDKWLQNIMVVPNR